MFFSLNKFFNIYIRNIKKKTINVIMTTKKKELLEISLLSESDDDILIRNRINRFKSLMKLVSLNCCAIEWIIFSNTGKENILRREEITKIFYQTYVTSHYLFFYSLSMKKFLLYKNNIIKIYKKKCCYSHTNNKLKKMYFPIMKQRSNKIVITPLILYELLISF